MNYDELVTRLRKRAINLKEKFSRNAELLSELMQAADAIEELQQTVEHYKGCVDDWYKEACDYKAALPRWISVKEQLPEKNSNYLIYGMFKPLNVGGLDIERFDGERFIHSANVEVTHWMPLPEPPKEET